LQAENAALSTPAERPPSRTSSIPVPKSKRPRSSSENRPPRFEEDLKTCRTELVETKEKLKKAEARARQTDETAIRLENEKTAISRKAQAAKAEFESSLQEAKDEIEILQLEIQSTSRKGASSTDFNELSKAYAGSKEQLESAIADKADLERRLARKTAQCETLQEKLDGCMFPASDDEALRQELADAQEEASRSKRQLAAVKKEMEVCRFPLFLPSRSPCPHIHLCVVTLMRAGPR
jgi:chromosome segregation ATPase